jgi:hypothetical protein
VVELPVPKKTYIDSFKDLSTTDKDPVIAGITSKNILCNLNDSKTYVGPKVFCLVGTVSSHDTPARLKVQTPLPSIFLIIFKDKIKEAQQKRKLLLRTNQRITDDKVLEHKEAISKV